MRRLPVAIIFGLATLLLGDGVMAYEEPDYTVLETRESFELRRYAPFLVAEMLVSGGFDEAGSRAFGRLFDYINNDERPEGKISMTVPVIQQPVAQKEASDSGSGGTERPAEQTTTYRFAFPMPSEYTREELPAPADEEIRIRQTSSRVLAARRYSGTWSEERYRKNEEILLEAIEEAGLKAIGEPIFARYNAPFSLWFLRRNEVLIEVDMP